jgi:hypothetical protein
MKTTQLEVETGKHMFRKLGIKSRIAKLKFVVMGT